MRTVKLELDIDDGDLTTAQAVYDFLTERLDEADFTGHSARAVLTMGARGDLLTGDEPGMQVWCFAADGTMQKYGQG